MSAQLLLRAARFAADRHRNQRRKGHGGEPYINHPLTVAAVLAENGVEDHVVLCAAILHDTVEDTETTREEITEIFGEDIAGVVAECTDDKSLPKTERKRQQVLHAPHMTDRGKLVKLADKLSNIRDVYANPPDWTVERKLAYFDWAELVVAGLRGVHAELEEAFDVALSEGRSGLAA